MNANGFLYCLCDVIRLCITTKMDGNRMLAGGYIDDGWWGGKELPVIQKIADSKGGRHDYESQRLEYPINR